MDYGWIKLNQNEQDSHPDGMLIELLVKIATQNGGLYSSGRYRERTRATIR